MKKMSNQFLKFGLTLCASLILAACGSNSSNDSNNTKNTVTTPTNTNTSKNNTSTSSNTSSSTTTVSAGTGQVAVTGNEGSSVKTTVKNINQAQLTSIVVDGKTIVLQQPGIYAGGWFTNSNSTFSSGVCCGRYSNVKIGYYEDQDKTYVYYNGIPTPQSQIPTSGSVTYTGDSLYAPANEKLEEDYYSGTAQLTANFTDKTLKGQLVNDAATISINSKISQNGFTGTATSNMESSTAKVEGKFYGANAAEIGGMATATQGNDTWGAAFAGKR